MEPKPRDGISGLLRLAAIVLAAIAVAIAGGTAGVLLGVAVILLAVAWR